MPPPAGWQVFWPENIISFDEVFLFYQNQYMSEEIISEEHVPEELEGVPTPDEIPIPVQVGSRGCLSETVDEVLTQNTDLMYRLTVALRRNANLETRVNQTEEENNYLKHKTKSMDDELDILRNENNNSSLGLKDISSKLSESEAKYARLYEMYSLQEENFKTTTKKLGSLNRFKNRVSFYVRLYIDRLKKQVASQKETEQKHLEEVEYFKNAIQELRKKVIHLENQLISCKRKENALRQQFAKDLEEAVQTIDKLKHQP